MLETLIIAFVVLLAVGIWFAVLEPLLSTAPATKNDEEEAAHLNVLQDLYARRDALYASIKELEFDRRVGKIDENDFHSLHPLPNFAPSAATVSSRAIDFVVNVVRPSEKLSDRKIRASYLFRRPTSA